MKYWVYLDGQIPGSYEPEELSGIPGFNANSMVCPAMASAEDRNWRQAGTFPDLAALIMRSEAAPPPAPEAPLPSREELGLPKSPEDILSDASNNIFRHVTRLMGELENRREESSMVRELQRQTAGLRSEVQALRERNRVLSDRAELIGDYEMRLKELMERAESKDIELKDKEASLLQLRKDQEGMKIRLEKAERSQSGLESDLRRQTIVSEDLSKQLAEKEILLAKAFAAIRRMESSIAQILPPPPMPQEAAPEPRAAVVEPAAAPVYDDAGIGGEEPSFIMPEPDPETVRQAPPETPVPEIPVLKRRHVEAPEDDLPPPPPAETQALPSPWQEKLKKASGFLRKKIGLDDKNPPVE